jgi:hypothetical protein
MVIDHGIKIFFYAKAQLVDRKIVGPQCDGLLGRFSVIMNLT